MRNLFLYFFYICMVEALFACHHKEATTEEVAPEEVQTPVTITHIEKVPLIEYADLNATSTYLQTNFIKASANGYLKSVNVHKGEYVNVGQLVFTLKTKEAEAIGNTINSLDSSFHFSGMISIHATASGYVGELNHQAGDYVQDGEQLALLSDSKGFGFLLNLPYELRRYVNLNQTLPIELP